MKNLTVSAGSSQFRSAMNELSPSVSCHWNPVAAVTLALLWVLCGSAHSSPLIQITPDDPSTTGAGFVVSSSGWNVLKPVYTDLPGSGLSDYGVTNLLDSNGNPTGISLAADDSNRFNAYNLNGSLVASPGFPADVKRESFFGNDVSFNGFIRPTATWVLGGFDPNDDLKFTFFASRMDSVNPIDNREGKYEVVGATTVSTTLDARENDTNTASVMVKADESGNVVLNMTKGPNNNNSFGFFYLNAMTINVNPINSAPVFTVDPIVGAAATQDLLYSGSIAGAATDADAGDTLAFTLQGTPTWLSVASDGTLSGTPDISHVGLNQFTVRVTDAAGAFDEAVLEITVNANSAPVFTVDPIVGAAATQDLLYSGSIAGTATDADEGDTLVYSLQGTPTWLSVASDGTLSGTPDISHVGLNQFTVRVTDPAGAFDEAVLEITVNANSTPVFTVDPIVGTAATQDLLYSGSIAGAATDADEGDTLVYSLQGTPTWLSVASDGTLSGTPDISHVGLNQFTVRVTDAAGAFDEAVLEITVNANSAPVFTVDPIVGTAATQDLLYSGSIAGAATDADEGDTLVYSLQGTPTWLSVASNGTLSGTPDISHVGLNQFTVRVTDAAGAFDEAVLEITVNANSAPVFTVDPIVGTAATQDLLYSGSIAGAATDADEGDTLVYSLQGTPTWLSVASDGTLSGTPDISHVGLNQFTVRVTDAAGAFDEAVLEITVNANSAPVFTVDPIVGTAATQDLLYSGSIAGTATDADAGDTLVYSLQGTPTWLSVASDGTLSGTPDISHVGLNQFTVRVTDPAGAFDEAVLEITVNPINSAPVFTVDPIVGTAATQDLLYSGSIAGAATDADEGDTLVYSLQGTPTWLSVASDGTLSGTPDISHVGLNQFTVRVTDAAGAFDEAVLEITVNANSAPVFTVDPIVGTAATQDLLYSGSIAGAATDADEGDTLVYSLQGTPTWLSVASDGTLSGTPDISHVGLNQFTVRVTDAAGAFDEAVLEITVNANSTPVFTTDPIVGTAATQDLLYSGSIAGAATDADEGDTLVYSLQGTPTWLSVASDGTLSGTPDISHVGLNQFTVRVTDAAGAFDEAVLEITVNANSAPVFTVDPIVGTAATQDLLYSGSIAGAATDADEGDTLVYSLQGTPTWLSVASDGTLSGTPDISHVGLNQFTVRVTDPAGAFDEAVLAITVNANSAPVFTVDPIVGTAATQDLLYSGSIAGAATDADEGDTLVYSLQGTPTWLSVASDGTLSGTPELTHVGLNQFTVRVTDPAGAFDEAVLEITVNANSAPVFTVDPIVGTAATQDLLYSGSIAGAATDADEGDTLVYSLQGTPTWLSVASDGTLSGTPDISHVGLNQFTVRVTDAAGAFDEAVLEITVNANSAPVFTVDPIVGTAATQDLLYSGSIAGAATDADEGDTLVYSLQGTPTWLSVASDGTLSGTPDISYVGLNQFTVRVTDPAGAFDEAVLEITVNAPVNDFDTWKAEYGITDGPEVDSDGDGISNIIEYIIGGDPAEQMDVDLLPSVQLVTADPDGDLTTSDYLLFTHRRTVRAANNPAVGIKVEWSTDLVAWQNAEGTAGVVIDDEPLESGVELVKVYIPLSLPANGKLFARLGASFATP
jgi:hypothetical protein